MLVIAVIFALRSAYKILISPSARSLHATNAPDMSTDQPPPPQATEPAAAEPESDSSTESDREAQRAKERRRRAKQKKRTAKLAKKAAKREQPASRGSVWRLALVPMSAEERAALVKRLI
jgi:hypothetical protein